LKTPIAITAIATISPLGLTQEEQWTAYTNNKTAIVWDAKLNAYIAPLHQDAIREIANIREENSHYKRLDASVLYGILAARKALKIAGWSDGDFGINVGSSRGATQLFESYYDDFKVQGTTQTLASPTTTSGNISSWLAHDLKSNGPDISHSITCSTALHAVLNGVAWLQSGMATRFLVGGTEAALTPFTIAQVKAMKLTPKQQPKTYPCKALAPDKIRNTMVLGEGAGMACLETGTPDNAIAYITGIGYATEILEHSVSLSSTGDCFQKSMRMALGDLDPSAVDAIVMHAPGTIKGDAAEIAAIATVFKSHKPLLTTNKWKVGHTFGASGILSVELAVQMLKHQKFIDVPYTRSVEQSHVKSEVLRYILVNAVGFGGNAVSVLVRKA